MSLAAPHRASRPRPRVATLLRHAVDAAAAPVAFLVADTVAGPRWGAGVALGVALLVAVVRRGRGEPQAVVAVSTVLVAMYSLSAIVVGEGRAFFLPELGINVAGLVVCLGSLALGRPVTGVVSRRLGLEPADRPTPRRTHVRLTLAWTVLWASHVVLMAWLYAADSVAGLTAAAALFNKPTMLAMAVATAVVVRRTRPEQGA
jgi:hypothetical protein